MAPLVKLTTSFYVYDQTVVVIFYRDLFLEPITFRGTAVKTPWRTLWDPLGQVVHNNYDYSSRLVTPIADHPRLVLKRVE